MTDIKRVLAYSTISQLGYMMLALGVGGYVAAIFHLFTHAFFKALLFLGSGSVNHATNTFDMRQDGRPAEVRCRSRSATFVIGGAQPGGHLPVRRLLEQGRDPGDAWDDEQCLFWVALCGRFLTAFYMFRAIFLTFVGEYQRRRHSPRRARPRRRPRRTRTSRRG